LFEKFDLGGLHARVFRLAAQGQASSELVWRFAALLELSAIVVTAHPFCKALGESIGKNELAACLAKQNQVHE